MKQTKCLLITLAFTTLVLSKRSEAQSNFFSSSVFSNKVSFNPSQSGIAGKWRGNALFKSPMDNSQPGLAKEYALIVDGPISESAGVSFNLMKQNTGILNQTLFHFNYAYGLTFNEKMKLRLGFSAGFKTNRVNITAFNAESLIGDLNDPTLLAFNSVPPSFFSAFGATLYTEDFEFQAAVPNLTASLQSSTLKTLDYALGHAALTYTKKLGEGAIFSEGAFLKLFAGASLFKQTSTVINGAAQVGFNEWIALNAMYASSGGITGGASIQVQKNIQLNLNYTTGGLYTQSLYGGTGIAELHLNYTFNKNK